MPPCLGGTSWGTAFEQEAAAARAERGIPVVGAEAVLQQTSQLSSEDQEVAGAAVVLLGLPVPIGH
jgi:hypothetical protein